MNPSTRIIVSAYAGDAHQIEILRYAYQHHECPVTIASPADAPILGMTGFDTVIGGRRQYFGQLSIDRQVEQMQMILERYDEEWFLFNDSDSFVIALKFPIEWYSDPNTIWSNEVFDPRIPGTRNPDPQIPCDIPTNYFETHPRIAMHPPWFLHRTAMEKLVKLGPLPADPITPFIDFYYVVACEKLGIQHKSMKGVSLPTYNDDLIQSVIKAVQEGAIAIHSVKTQGAFDRIMTAYGEMK